MLTQLQVSDFAIIDAVDIELDAGLTVMTGETGAGKSILVDALGFLLGDRADTGAIRHGAEQAEVVASFGAVSQAARDWLTANDLDAEDECVVRRVVKRNGRSSAYVNGRGVPRQTLRELGAQLMDIHGQHAHQSLLARSEQRRIVDAHGGHAKLLAATSSAHEAWAGIAAEAERLHAAQAEREARLDILRYQARELTELDFRGAEIEQLEHERARLANLEKLIDGVAAAREAIDADSGRPGATRLISLASAALAPLANLDPALARTHELLEQADIHLSEAAGELQAYAVDLEPDPARLNEIEGRMAAAQTLARKHRVELAQLPAQTERLRAELADLENLELRLEEIESRRSAATEDYLAAAEKLSKARRRAAKRLATRIQAGIAELGMPDGRFEIDIESSATPPFDAHGIDTIAFGVSANAGQPAGALAKVASGGELSRIGLAIQVVAAGLSRIPSMVFDEVDSGIGGGTAEIVGQQLRALSGHCQVLCVTHLPQVASQADQHLRVVKLSDGKTTRTSVSSLNKAETVEELARMLGGVEITRKTRAHAAEMIQRARGG